MRLGAFSEEFSPSYFIREVCTVWLYVQIYSERGWSEHFAISTFLRHVWKRVNSRIYEFRERVDYHLPVAGSAPIRKSAELYTSNYKVFEGTCTYAVHNRFGEYALYCMNWNRISIRSANSICSEKKLQYALNNYDDQVSLRAWDFAADFQKFMQSCLKNWLRTVWVIAR